MARKPKVPSTPALRLLRKSGVAFEVHPYPYVARGGTAASAQALGVDERCVIKTLVMEDQDRAPLLVLMHGDRSVSTKALARQLERRSIQPCAPAVADRHSGYQVGGTSPFATRKPMPVCMERSILELERVFINGGARGLLVAIAPADIAALLEPTLVDCAR